MDTNYFIHFVSFELKTVKYRLVIVVTRLVITVVVASSPTSASGFRRRRAPHLPGSSTLPFCFAQVEANTEIRQMLCEIRRGAKTGELLCRVDTERSTVAFGQNRNFSRVDGPSEYIEHAVAKNERALIADSYV